jgi:nucleotide-binding universal stress UspA family protein
MLQKRILVATDFSTRSDRALRRATLIAHAMGGRVTLVHAVDDDQPRNIVESERSIALSILKELSITISRMDGLDCDIRLLDGDPFQAIAQEVQLANPDVVVIGPHRRQALRDVFVGTTAERTVRHSTRPVLMANGVPASTYRHALVAIDFSPGSGETLRWSMELSEAWDMAVSVVHVYDALAAGLVAVGTEREEAMQTAMASEVEAAKASLDRFLSEQSVTPMGVFLEPNTSSIAVSVLRKAKQVDADLVVVGTRQRASLPRLILGSVAQELFQIATIDVLVIPPSQV